MQEEKRGPFMTTNKLYFLGKWQCRICRNEYYPEAQSFAKLPENWHCPVCGSHKWIYTGVGISYPKTVIKA
jgi:rubredoxin